MPKLASLTGEQKSAMKAHAEMWIERGLSCTPANRERVESGIRASYVFAGLAAPKNIVWVKSPSILSVAGPTAAYILDKSNRGSVNDAVGGSVRIAVRIAVDDAVGGAVDDAVGGAVGVAVGDAVNGAVDRAVRGSVNDAVDGSVRIAVRIAVDDAVNGAVRGAVDATVDDAVGDAVNGAVDRAVRDAVGGSVRVAVSDAVRIAVDDAVGGSVRVAVNDAVNVAVDRAVNDAVDFAVRDAVGGSVRDAVNYAVGGAVNDAVRDAVGGSVRIAVRIAVDDAVGGAVDDAVGGAVNVAVGVAVGGAVSDAVRVAVGDAVGDAVGIAVRAAVGGAVDGAVGGAVGVAVGDAVLGAVGDAVRVAVRDAVGDVKKELLSRIGKWHQNYMAGQWWGGGWYYGLPYVTFFRDVVSLPLQGDTWARSHANEDMMSAGWLWLHSDFAMVCETPAILRREDEGRGTRGVRRLHCVDGPAIQWRDNTCLYYIRGVRVTEQIVMRPETLTVEQIRDERNAEVRRFMIDRFGASEYLRAENAECAQEDECGKLYKIALRGDAEDLAIVEVINSTPEPMSYVPAEGENGRFIGNRWHKHYMLRVPPSCKTAREAVAWTMQIPPDEYAPALQT